MSMSALRKHVISSKTEQRLISHGLTLIIEKDYSQLENDGDFTVVALQPIDSSLLLHNNKELVVTAAEEHVDAICQEEWNCLASDIFWKPVYDIGMGYVRLTTNAYDNDLMVHGKFYGVLLIRHEDLRSLHYRQETPKTDEQLIDRCLKEVSAEDNDEVFTLTVQCSGTDVKNPSRKSLQAGCHDIDNTLDDITNNLIDNVVNIVSHLGHVGWGFYAGVSQSFLELNIPASNHIVSSIYSKLGFLVSLGDARLAGDPDRLKLLIDIKSIPSVMEIAMVDDNFPLKVLKYLKTTQDTNNKDGETDFNLLIDVMSNDFAVKHGKQAIHAIVSALFEYVEGLNIDITVGELELTTYIEQ